MMGCDRCMECGKLEPSGYCVECRDKHDNAIRLEERERILNIFTQDLLVVLDARWGGHEFDKIMSQDIFDILKKRICGGNDGK